jgi:hypothetical protein
VTPPPQTIQADTDEEPPSPQHLILQAAVDGKLYLIDVTAFIRSFNEDGNFSLDQLSRLSDHAPDAIPLLLEKWPHVVNYRDVETGDTVVHHCARTGNAAETSWLSRAVPFSLLLNTKGHSALREAVVAQHLPAARVLMMKLDPSLPLGRTAILMKDLLCCAVNLPGQLDSLITLLEDDQHYCLFRSQKEVAMLTKRLEGFEVRASPDALGLASWESYFQEDQKTSVRCDCVLEVLALRGFAAGPQGTGLSPYAQLYEACKANGEASLKALLRTRLMIVSTQFKWTSFTKGRKRRVAFLQLAHFLLAASTFVYTTRIIVRHGSIATLMPDALHAALLFTNTKCLYDEVRQMKLAWRYEAINYLNIGSIDAMWNLLDLGGIAAVYVACAAYFQGETYVVQRGGSLAVLLNSFSLLQVMRPFTEKVSHASSSCLSRCFC